MRLRNYFERIRRQTSTADADDAGWQRLLIKTEIMTEEGVTVGGMLLFGTTPNRFLPHPGIDAAAFQATLRVESGLCFFAAPYFLGAKWPR
jgi:ATP-dependent DNA helicase RecG